MNVALEICVKIFITEFIHKIVRLNQHDIYVIRSDVNDMLNPWGEM